VLDRLGSHSCMSNEYDLDAEVARELARKQGRCGGLKGGQPAPKSSLQSRE
jgi:hypothetical protein